MELDATTFILEIVNFLVLLWLLNRFFFKPVRAALQARADAEAARNRAVSDERAALAAQREALAQEKAALATQGEQAKAALMDEIEALRRDKLKALDDTLRAEREKATARMEEERARQCDRSEQAMRARGAAFVSDYLQRLASPAMEAAIIALFLQDLAAHPADAAQALRDGRPLADGDAGADNVDPAVTRAPAVLELRTAYPVDPGQRAQVEAELIRLMGGEAHLVWHEDPSLLAGICAHLPGHQLEASLRRGIDAFADEPLSGVA
jgi:F-type H+-transporting ATPase subunit b